jgi:hypothetical protein
MPTLRPPKAESQLKSKGGTVTIGKLANLDNDGNAPDSRLETAMSAHAAFDKCEKDAYEDRSRIISIRGIYDGHPPLSQQDLDDSGLGDMPNLNLKQFSGKIDAYCSAWNDLNCSGDSFLEVMASDEFTPPEYIPQVSGLLTRFANDAILDWAAVGTMNAGNYIRQSAIRDTQMGLFGLGPATMLDQFDWRFTAMPLHRVLVPRGTFLDMSNCQVGFIKWKMPLPQMFEEVRDEERAREKGWNPIAVLWAIYKYQNTSEGKGSSNWAFIKWMNEIRDNDPDWSKFNAPEVKLVHVYVMEFGKDDEPIGISHKIIPAGGLCEYGYLFASPERYETWGNIIIPFCDRVGPEGIWHGIKGFGDDIYDSCHFNNTLFNWTATNAILNGMPVFTSSDGDTRNRLARVKMTRMGILYPGITPTQLKLNLDIAGTMQIFSESNIIMDQNTRIWGQAQTPQTTARGKPSPTEIMQSVMSQTQFSSTQIKNYRTTGLDPLFSEMYRRLTADGYNEKFPGGKQAKRFRDQCERHKITKKMFQGVKWVRADRNGSTGNTAVDFQRAQQVYTVATPGKGQLQARKDMVAALKGREVVPAYVEDTPQPMPDDKTIDLENQLMEAGQTPTALPNEDHMKHLGPIDPKAAGHIGSMLKTQQSASQIQDNLEQYMAKIGSDPLAVMRNLDAHIAHSAQHEKALEASPLTREAAKPYAKILNDVHGFAVQFAGNIQKALVAKRPDAGGDPKVQREQALTQAKVQSMGQLTAAEIHRKNVAHKVKLQNLIEATHMKALARLKDSQHALGIKAEQTMAEIEMNKHKQRHAMAALDSGGGENGDSE